MDTAAILDRVPWRQVAQEAIDLLRRYIAIDTSNPPGREEEAAAFLAEALRADGIEACILRTAPGRANLLARLEGAEAGSAVMLLHHMDVIPAEPEGWQEPPFGGVLRDGYIWGRGALDAKGLGVVQLMAFRLLRRLGVPLARGVLLAAVADEEAGGGLGTAWLVGERWEDLRPACVWDEGGLATVGVVSHAPLFAVAVAEKRPVTLRLTATGASGHGALASDSAVQRLVAALARLSRLKRPLRPSDLTARTFEGLARVQTFPLSAVLRRAHHPLARPFLMDALARLPAIEAMLRDTVALTGLEAGQATNVAPGRARATLDVRLLPDTDLEEFLQWLRSALGDPAIAVEVVRPPPPPGASPLGSPFLAALEGAVKAIVPDAVVVPILTPVTTDSRFFRARGVPAYGILPVVVGPQEVASIHGADERLPAEGLAAGIRIALDVLLRLCTVNGRS